MTRLQARLRRFVRDEAGVTSIEYGLIASLVALAVLVGAAALGVKLDDFFNYVAGLMRTA